MNQPPPHPSPLSETDAKYQAILHELMDMATDIARSVHKQATDSNPENNPALEAPDGARPAAPDHTLQFDRIARTIRRTIALARSLHEPPHARNGRTGMTATPDRTRARIQLIRKVEDRIEEHNKGQDARALRAELQDRLDDPDLDDDIAHRPIAEIIHEICNDLGLNPFHPLRRTPEDVATLAIRAAQPTVPGPRSPHPDRRPPKPRQNQPMDDATMVAHLLASAKSRPPPR